MTNAITSIFHRADPPRLLASTRAVNRGPAWAWLLLALLPVLFVYAGTLRDSFLLDDFWLLSQARHTHGLAMLQPWEYSGQDYQAYWFSAQRLKGQHEPGFFRPLVTLGYAGGLKLWGANPRYFHLVNILLHLLTTACVFWLLSRLLRPRWAAALGAAAYGLHPGHYESVGWVAANADAFAGLFGALCVAAYVEYRTRDRNALPFYFLSLASLVLALGSKEMAVTVPLILLGYETLRVGPRQVAAHCWRQAAPMAALVLAYGLWRARSAVGIYQLNQGGSYMIDLASPLFVPQMVLNFALFAFHAVLPYPILPISFAETLGVWCWPAAGAAAIGVVLLARVMIRLAGDEAPTAKLGLWWFTATLLPFCFLTPSQHIVHLPLAGWALALAAMAMGVGGRIGGRQPRARWAAAGALVMLAVYAGLAASYVTVLGMAARFVHDVTSGVDKQVQKLPANSQVYLINLWQPAWMFEHSFAFRYPDKHYDIQVLSFDPKLLSQDRLHRTQILGRAFADFFPEQVGQTDTRLQWVNPLTLRVDVDNAVYFRGPVERELPVADEAETLHHPVRADSFTAEATAGNAEGVTELTFRFEPPQSSRERIFLYYDGKKWKRVDPPTKVAVKTDEPAVDEN